MPTTAAQRTIETIEAEIELARSVYLAADADATSKASTRAIAVGLARAASVAAADKALTAARVYTESMEAYSAASIEASDSYAISYAAYEAYQIATSRLQALRDELATGLRTRRIKLAASRTR